MSMPADDRPDETRPADPADAGDRLAAASAALDLLARTAELPDSKRDLLAVLGEYRRALRLLAQADAAATPAR